MIWSVSPCIKLSEDKDMSQITLRAQVLSSKLVSLGYSNITYIWRIVLNTSYPILIVTMAVVYHHFIFNI